MSNLEMGLIVALVVVVLILVLMTICAYQYFKKALFLTKDNEEIDMQNDLIIQKMGVTEKQSLDARNQLKEAIDQLKQIKDLSEAGKKSIIDLNFRDGEDIALEKIEADKITFDEDLVILSNAGKNVACLDRSRFVLFKYTLVDIDKTEEEK